MKFKVGDIVRFITDGQTIPEYEYFDADDYAPNDLGVIHGSTLLGSEYENNGAEVVGEHDGYYLVRYISNNGKPVQLYFLSNVLELSKSLSWKERIDRIDAPSSVTE